MANSDPQKASDLVHNSRAGDQFHYRWAARKCLRMIHPKSELSFVTVEASEDQNMAGEYVIDVAEYFEREAGSKQVRYSQLKHSEVRTDTNFTISELSKTLKGFAERFQEHESDTTDDQYFIITNRKVSNEFKKALTTVCSGENPSKRPLESLKNATSLSDVPLRSFCTKLSIVDGEGDYLVQKNKLQQETGAYIAGFIRADFVDRLIQLVAERALPRDVEGNSNHKITRENVLEKIGVYDSSQLFPASSEIEQLPNPIRREQHDELFSAIGESDNPIIITAEGGVGKSIFSQQLVNYVPAYSKAILYDCFGAGEYRNPARPRHEPQQALIQIVNECAREGLCKSLLPTEVTDYSSLYRKFEERLVEVVTHLKEVDSSAELMIIVDAADNAEMQATHKSDRCFVDELFKVNFPDDTRLVMLCRPERLELLQAPSTVDVLPLQPFSVQESSIALRKSYPEATDSNCEEFHRLSGGNPRVQAYALNEGSVDSLADALNLLGPNPTKVSDQIEDLLAKGFAKVKDRLVGKFVNEINSICEGLANLPPLVPLEVLSRAAEVEISTVKSFISELGRALLLTEENVLFRDEPTEHWFKKKFPASPSRISKFIERIKPMAAESDYVARALPPLMLEANQYDELINFALRDIEQEGRAPSDVQSVRLFNLRFAFKAALKRDDLKSASMISIRLGEEAASSERRLSYLRKNLDLVPPLLGPEHAQELAYQSKIKSGWMGSQNVFSASLLSAIPGCSGYANSYLRATGNWIRIYFDKRDKEADEDENFHHRETLSDEDVSEILWAIFCLDGLEASMDYISNWKPDSRYFYVLESFTERLVDAGHQQLLVEYLHKEASSFYITLAIIHQIFRVGLLPGKCDLNPVMEALLDKERRPKLNRDMGMRLDPLPDAIIAFLEVFLKCGGDHQMIIDALDTHRLNEVSYPPTHDSEAHRRRLYLRAVCLRSYALNGKEPDPLAPTFDRNNDEASYAIDQMIPIYFRRLLALNGGISEALEKTLARSASYDTQKYYRQFDYIKRERFSVLFESSYWITQPDDEIHEYLLSRVGTPDSLQLPDRINCLRSAYRQEHLSKLRDPLEQFVKGALSSYTEYDNPESKAEEYAALARAVLNLSPEAAKVYLNCGLDVSEMVGDEAVSRWTAITTVAKNVARESEVSWEIHYKYIRCAEYVGDVVQREKYWDRDAAVEIGYELNPSAAIAALSRWRDREVGYFDRHIDSILRKGLGSGHISGEFAWSFTGLEGCNASLGLVEDIFSHLNSLELEKVLLGQTKRDVEIYGATESSFKKLEAIFLATHGSDAGKLEMEVQSDPASNTERRSAAQSSISEKYSRVNVSSEMNVLNEEVIRILIEEFDNLEYPRSVELFVEDILAAVPHGKEYEFVEAFLNVFPEHFPYYNVPEIISAIRNVWGKKTSIEANWIGILERIGKVYARSILSYHSDRSLFKELAELPEEIHALKKGARDGVFDLIEGLNSDAYFGFAASISSSLNFEDSLSLLEFGLLRFERNLEEEFSDGQWDDWLDAKDDVIMSYASLIWGCLGSPDSSVRWQGAHCVRRAVEVNCEALINCLVKLFDSGLDRVYLGKELPNYELHAKVYFLTGCKRALKSTPEAEILSKHSDFFKEAALESVGLFIKRTAAEIALLLHGLDTTLYSADEISSLSSLLESKSEPIRTDRSDAKFDLPAKLVGLSDKSEFSIGMDFDSYWLNGLADAFRIKKSDLRELVVSQIREIEGISDSSQTRVRNDPRRQIWNSVLHGQRAYDTSYSHFSYPRIEDYQFYTTYHGLMNAAALLFESMPYVIDTSYSDGECDEWIDWLDGHLHTRKDGTWLSDRRDPIPTKSSKWLSEENTTHEIWSLDNDLFREAVMELSPHPQSIVVDGNWTDYKGYSHYMRTSIRSAFVSTETSGALVEYLSGAEDYMCCFPNRENQSASRKFRIIRPSQRFDAKSSGRDEYDPYANDICFPPIELSSDLAIDFELQSDSSKRVWKKQDGVSVVSSLVWRDPRPYHREDNRREGSQLSVDIELIKQCCIRYESHLVMIVTLDRGETERYRRGSSYTDERIPESRKIYILGKDGNLRETS